MFDLIQRIMLCGTVMLAMASPCLAWQEGQSAGDAATATDAPDAVSARTSTGRVSRLRGRSPRFGSLCIRMVGSW